MMLVSVENMMGIRDWCYNLVLFHESLYDIASCSIVRFFFFFKQKTAYEVRISDWSSDVCSSDLCPGGSRARSPRGPGRWRPRRTRVPPFRRPPATGPFHCRRSTCPRSARAAGRHGSGVRIRSWAALRAATGGNLLVPDNAVVRLNRTPQGAGEGKSGQMHDADVQGCGPIPGVGNTAGAADRQRAEERRGGKECDRTCTSMWAP